MFSLQQLDGRIEDESGENEPWPFKNTMEVLNLAIYKLEPG